MASDNQVQDAIVSDLPHHPKDSQTDQSAAISELQSELDQTKSELTRLQIESEAELHASNIRLIELESKFEHQSAIQSKLDGSLEEIKKLKQALELSTGNENAFNKKLDELQTDKRNLLELIRDKETEHSELEADLHAKNEQLLSSKSTIRELETNLLSTRESERAIRLQAQASHSEATLARSDRDFYAKELERTREECQSFRAQSHQQTAQLQNDLDKLTHAHEGVNATLNALRSQHIDLQKLHTDATERIKHLTNQSIEAEAAFQKEIEAQKRVTELMDKRDKQRTEKMEQFEKEYNRRRIELDEREKILSEALENERAHSAELQQKLLETTNALSRLCESQLQDDSHDYDESGQNSSYDIRAPTTPLLKQPNAITLTNGLSPAAVMASKLQKNGKSLTEVYTEKIALEEELKKAKLENIRLSETMSQILGEIQDRAPLLHQQRVEHERIERECDELTSQLTRIIEEKEEVERKYQSCLLDLDALQRDHDLSNRQVNDLSLQVRVLTKELIIRESGDQLSIQGDEEDLMKSVDELPHVIDEEDDDVMLSNDLVTFKTIADLQQKNLKLLMFSRKLTVKLQELEDNHHAKNSDNEDDDDETKQAIDEAHDLILQLKNDLKSAQNKSEAMTRERDMLKRMLDQTQARTNRNTDLSYQGLNPDESKQKLEELHTQFEAYRVEIGADTKRINEDLNQARTNLSTTQVLLAKANAQIEYLNERHRVLEQTNSMHAQEVQTLTASSIKLQEHIAKSELLLHHANENVTDLKAKCHILQHQIETLATEKEVWKGIEGRLTAENTSLARERNNLGDILRNMQAMQGELERNGVDSRRRLEAQVSKLEESTRHLKEQIRIESENSRQSTLQRELERKDYQSKLDKLNAEHLTARENLSAALATKEQLEAQVGTIQKQLAIKQERLAVYEGRQRVGGHINRADGNSDPSGDTILSKEQQLEIEISELKIELAAAREESTRAAEHIEQFKAISQSAEAALASLTATHDEYKISQEAELQQKQTALTSLEEHSRKLTEDLATAANQNSDLHRQLESQRLEFEREKLRFTNKLSELEDIEARAKARENELREEVKQQVKLAHENHDRYQAEVQNHANSLNELKHVKDELVKTRELVSTSEAAAQAAAAKLTSSEASWLEQKTALQKEVSSIQTRCDDLINQNNLLHEHLETVSAQAAKISNSVIENAVKVDAVAGQDTPQADLNENMVESVEQLRGVIRYLRNNYDIAQQQIELLKLESARLQQQLQHASKALDQTRLELNHERERSRKGYVSSVEHSKLLDQINTLNLVRESNTTLRDEVNRSERKAKQLEERLAHTTQTLEPLQAELRELKITVKQYQEEITILTEDNERWKTRNQQILEKYDRIDPAEVQSLRDLIAQLQQDLNQAREETAQLQQWREKFYGIQAQARNSRQRFNEEKATLESKLSSVTEELAKLKETIQTMENEAKAFQTQTNATTEKATTQAQEQIKALRQEKDAIEMKLTDAVKAQAALDALKVEFEESKAALANRESYFARLLADNKTFASTNRQLNAEIAELKARANVANLPSEETIEAEVAKRLQEKVADLPSTETIITEQKLQEQLQEANKKAAADKDEAIRKTIDETTQRLTDQFAKSQAEAIEKVKAELASCTETGIPEDLVGSQVASKVAGIRLELETTAAEKEKELITKYESQLEEARQSQSTALDASKRLSDEELQEKIKVAVDAAVKSREAELIKVHTATLETVIETTKSKVVAEMNSKANVIQMQLKRAHATIAELKRAVPAPVSSATMTTAPSTSLVATASPFHPSTGVNESPKLTTAPSGPISPAPVDAQTTKAEINAPMSQKASPPKPTSGVIPIFGKGNGLGIRGAGAGMAIRGGAPGLSTNPRDLSLKNAGGGNLPVEGRMTDNQTITSGSQPIVASVMNIRGAASKRGNFGGGSLLGAAVKAATAGVIDSSTSNNPTTTINLTPGKRAREEEGNNISNNNNNDELTDNSNSLKRPKGLIGHNNNEEEKVVVSNELASRLSMRP